MTHDSGKFMEDKVRAKMAFPWFGPFEVSLREETGHFSYGSLIKFIKQFHSYADMGIKDCYNRPNRAGKLQLLLECTLCVFHFSYDNLTNKPTSKETNEYLSYMTELVSMVLDLKIRTSSLSSRSLKRIGQDISSVLHTYLFDSEVHMCDAILKCRYFTKKNQELCKPVIKRFLTQALLFAPTEEYYFRYILAFKLWRKLELDEESRRRITSLATEKLIPGPEIIEGLKVMPGVSHLLPKTPFINRNMTLFLLARCDVNFAILKKAFLDTYSSLQNADTRIVPEKRSTSITECQPWGGNNFWREEIVRKVNREEEPKDVVEVPVVKETKPAVVITLDDEDEGQDVKPSVAALERLNVTEVTPTYECFNTTETEMLALPRTVTPCVNQTTTCITTVEPQTALIEPPIEPTPIVGTPTPLIPSSPLTSRISWPLSLPVPFSPSLPPEAVALFSPPPVDSTQTPRNSSPLEGPVDGVIAPSQVFEVHSNTVGYDLQVSSPENSQTESDDPKRINNPLPHTSLPNSLNIVKSRYLGENSHLLAEPLIPINPQTPAVVRANPPEPIIQDPAMPTDVAADPPEITLHPMRIGGMDGPMDSHPHAHDAGSTSFIYGFPTSLDLTYSEICRNQSVLKRKMGEADNGISAKKLHVHDDESNHKDCNSPHLSLKSTPSNLTAADLSHYGLQPVNHSKDLMLTSTTDDFQRELEGVGDEITNDPEDLSHEVGDVLAGEEGSSVDDIITSTVQKHTSPTPFQDVRISNNAGNPESTSGKSYGLRFSISSDVSRVNLWSYQESSWLLLDPPGSPPKKSRDLSPGVKSPDRLKDSRESSRSPTPQKRKRGRPSKQEKSQNSNIEEEYSPQPTEEHRKRGRSRNRSEIPNGYYHTRSVSSNGIPLEFEMSGS